MTSKPRRSVWPIVAVLVLLPVLYVASIGPAYWFATGLPVGPLSQAASWFVDIFYEPLYGLARHKSPLRRFILWYTELFGS